MKITKHFNSKYTVSGTDIDEVKRQNGRSGLTYNEIKSLLQKQYEEKGHPR